VWLYCDFCIFYNVSLTCTLHHQFYPLPIKSTPTSPSLRAPPSTEPTSFLYPSKHKKDYLFFRKSFIFISKSCTFLFVNFRVMLIYFCIFRDFATVSYKCYGRSLRISRFNDYNLYNYELYISYLNIYNFKLAGVKGALSFLLVELYSTLSTL